MTASHVNALRIDGPSLYQLLTSKTTDSQGQNQEMPTEVAIYGYDNEVIRSIEIARRNKDAVFNAVFDMSSIHEVCKSYGLKFEQGITVLAGEKSVRLLGSKIIAVTPDQPTNKQSFVERISGNPKVVAEARKPLCELKASLGTCQKEVQVLELKLEEALRSFDEQNVCKRLKSLRKSWGQALEKKTLYQEITEAKELRDELYMNINHLKDGLKEEKQNLYFKQLALRHYKRLSEGEITGDDLNPPARKLQRETRGLASSEECVLESTDQFTFSGTDNGLVNMTTAVPFSLERFKFHLALHNYYSVLENESEGIPVQEDELKKFLTIPKAVTISSSEVDFGCGLFKKRVKLQRRKNHTQQGRQIQAIEKTLSEACCSTSAKSLAQYKENLNLHLAHRSQLREFYHTKKLVNESRQSEIQKHRFKHRMCRTERRRLIKNTGNKLDSHNSTLF